MTEIHNILTFWFDELGSSRWFAVDEQTDNLIRDRFKKVHEAAARGELYLWRATPEGRLAEIIILDQFSRNIYRGNPKAFETDPMALVLAQELVFHKLDREIPLTRRAFAYLPFMHSESALIHELAMQLFSHPGLENNLKFERLHKDIIDRFGRYPHRNKILGRVSTAEEMEFLKTHSGF